MGIEPLDGKTVLDYLALHFGFMFMITFHHSCFCPVTAIRVRNWLLFFLFPFHLIFHVKLKLSLWYAFIYYITLHSLKLVHYIFHINITITVVILLVLNCYWHYRTFSVRRIYCWTFYWIWNDDCFLVTKPSFLYLKKNAWNYMPVVFILLLCPNFIPTFINAIFLFTKRKNGGIFNYIWNKAKKDKERLFLSFIILGESEDIMFD